MRPWKKQSSAKLAILVFAVLLAVAGPAGAHGPTVVISAAGFEPALLNLFEGTTVHFTNAIAGPDGVVVTDEAGSFSSPPIAASGDGWHYTFEKIGAHAIRVVGRPEATMRVVVVKKPPS